MLVIENMAALVAFIICLLAFVAGYALRQRVDVTREEWAAYSNHGTATSKVVRYGRR